MTTETTHGNGNGNGSESKIKDVYELSKIVADLRAGGRAIVLAHGVFDYVHPGLVRHLEAARGEGDVLVVTLVPDDPSRQDAARPHFQERLRARTLAALAPVDYVAVHESSSAVDAIRLLRPDVFAVPRLEETPESEAARDAVAAIGGRLHATEEVLSGQTHLLKAEFGAFSAEAEEFLKQFRRRYTASDVRARLDQLRGLKVLVVGDTIIDEYHYCRPYGMASKSNSVAAQYLSEEAHAGGILAIANHLAGFVDRVDLVTCLGEQDSRHGFVTKSIKANVRPRLFSRPDATTIVKRRYVASFLVTKLFEVSFFNDAPLPASVETAVDEHLDAVAADYDLVVVADFGHGFMTPRLVRTLSHSPAFLAVNAQVNSINKGYNVITKYPRVDYASIDEEEARMASRDRHGPLRDIVERLARDVHAKTFSVTRGHHGSVVHTPGVGFSAIPVLSREVVDPIGAGDAFLAITAPCAALRFPPDLLGFIGNAVGALAVRYVGNKQSVEPAALHRFIDMLLR